MHNSQTAVPYFPPLPAMSQDDLLALFDRLLPNHYLAPLKSPGPGYEYLQAVAKMNARVSEAVAHMATGCYIGSATGGTYATATVEFYRDSFLYGAVTLLKGTVVGTEDGYLYQTMAEVSFGATDLGPHAVQVQALTRGWNWNKPGPVVTASGATVVGSITQLVGPVVSPVAANFDPTLQVRQTTEATGGSSPMLDGLGLDRGILRSESFATVQLTRDLPATDKVIVLAGTRLATASGYLYRTLEPVTFLVGDIGPYTVRATPLIRKTQAEIDAEGLIASGTAGIALVRWGSPTADATLAVVVSSQTPYSKESDDSYRARIAFLPETVTPVSIQNLVEQILGDALRSYGETWDFREIWDIRYQTAYSETSTGTGTLDFPKNQTFETAEIGVKVPPYSSNIFIYDYDTSAGNPDALSNRFLAGEQDRGQIVFALPLIPELGYIYADLVRSLEAAKAAGTALAFVVKA